MSQHLKLSRDPDLFFSVEYHGSNYSTMVAPGLFHIYNVRFSPSEKRDYEFRVEFINDTEIFAIPVIGEERKHVTIIHCVIIICINIFI